jgi:DNA-binding beta-propeller fold protein YncE
MIRTAFLWALLVNFALPSLVAADGGAPSFVLEWGTAGSGDGQFNGPYGIAIDPNGYVYVCDQYNERIQKFGPDGTFMTAWGTYGLDPGQFDVPLSIGVDASGHVVVADTADRVQVFTSDGVLIYEWLQPGGASPTIRDLAVDPAGVIYIADVNAERIEKYTLTGGSLGSVGGGMGIQPGSVALDPSGNIYVGRYGEIRQIVKFGPDGSVLARFGQEGNGDGQFPVARWLGRDLRSRLRCRLAE